jgi:RimJ/RimL family protein N-acetyltransferase
MSWEMFLRNALENDAVRLRPIEEADREQYRAIAFEPDIWKHSVTRITTDEEFEAFLRNAIDDTASGQRIVFCVIDKKASRVAGSMSYGNLSEKEKRLEIGWSWLGKDFRGTGINRWAKYLLLKHAFERLDCERVEFKTDILNLRARKGLANIGATEEGVFRSYNYMPDNRRRDAVFYSIIKAEWPHIQRLLSTEVRGV